MHVVIRGRLTRGPELRFTPAGKAVANLGIVDQRRRKNDQTGEWEDASAPTFVDVSIWGADAEHLAEIGYGAHTRGKVTVTGNLESQTYTAKDGTERARLVIPFADAVAIVPSENRSSDAGRLTRPQGNAAPHRDPWTQTPQAGGWAPRDTDEPPF